MVSAKSFCEQSSKDRSICILLKWGRSVHTAPRIRKVGTRWTTVISFTRLITTDWKVNTKSVQVLKIVQKCRIPIPMYSHTATVAGLPWALAINHIGITSCRVCSSFTLFPEPAILVCLSVCLSVCRPEFSQVTPGNRYEIEKLFQNSQQNCYTWRHKITQQRFKN